jgi:hypothetical protein
LAKIFISYAREDRPFVNLLDSALRLFGHDVWFDRELGAGAFRDQILARLKAADVAVVIWSKRSKESRFVIDEAERAVSRGVLLPIRIDESELPLGFGTLHTFDLSIWEGSADDANLAPILAQLERIAKSPAPTGKRTPIAIMGKSVVLAILLGLVGGPILAVLNALKHGQSMEAIRLVDVIQGIGLASACAIPVMVWSGLRIRSFGLSDPGLIFRRAGRVYGFAALGAIMIAALATVNGVTQGLSPAQALSQLVFVVVVATLALGAAFAIGAITKRLIGGFLSAGR